MAGIGLYFRLDAERTLSAEEIEGPDAIHLPLMSKYCWPDEIAAGALPQQPAPVLCMQLADGPDTSTQSANGWHDDFDHGLAFGGFQGTDYKIFDALAAYKSSHWRHANHWMVDLAPHPQQDDYGWDKGAVMMRPDRSFTFENGKLIVEADVAAGMEAYGVLAWPEIIVSTGLAPIGRVRNGTYGYDMFPQDWTLGCRLDSSRHPVCALKKNNGTNNEASTRVWEMSYFQKVGSYVFGGNEHDGRGDYWRVCKKSDPDRLCRDRFRLELTRTSVTLYVNGIKYFQQTGIPPLPNAMVNGNIYVYYAGTHVRHPAEALRFHWDRLTVNTYQPPSAASNFNPTS